MTENSPQDESANSFEEAQKISLIQKAAAHAKREVSRTATLRINSYERAMRLLPLVEQGRRELKVAFHEKFYLKEVGDNAIAKWLKNSGHKAPQGRDWRGKQVREVLMRAPERIIECAVLECRTRMTVLALSADFAKPIDAVTELEREYLNYIAQALDIEHRLNGNFPRTSEELLIEAKDVAIRVATSQRAGKHMSMEARLSLWSHFPPPVRKVFGS